jgi:Uma2 family endonuclease
VRVKAPATEEDLMRMPKDGSRYELVDGEITASPPTYMRHAVIAAKILSRLMGHLEANPVGIAVPRTAGFRLPDGNVRCPDVGFVRNEKLPGGEVPWGLGEFAPDLAVEILSTNESLRYLFNKIGEYLQCGVPLVWLVDPDATTVTTFRSLTDVCTLRRTDTITGDPVLPGFSCRVDQFFPE